MSDGLEMALRLQAGLKAWHNKDHYLRVDDPTMSPRLRKAFRDNWDVRIGSEKFGRVWSIREARSNKRHPASVQAQKVPRADWSKETVTLDHAVPVAILFGLFWDADTRDAMQKVIDAYAIAIITKDENARLREAKLNEKMPLGWEFGDDPLARWHRVGIEVPDVRKQ